MKVTRWSGVCVLVALTLIVVSVAVLAPAVQGAARSTAQTTDLLEVSESCVAIGQRFPTLTVWGSGFEGWLQAPGNSLFVEWSWGGAPTSPDPAIVVPISRVAPGGTFTMTFDVTGVSQGFGGFNVVASNAAGIRTQVIFVDVNINPTCPVGTASCSTSPGPGAVLVSSAGYDPTWAVQFFYQYRLPDQTGPVTGTVAPDGSVNGRFQPAPQSANATVTALITEPPGSDSPSHTFFNTFAAPVCHDMVAALSITPGSFDFGLVNVGSASGAVTFNVVNVGTLPAPINGIAIAGGQATDFMIDANGCNVTLKVGAGCPVTVHFAPGAAGVRAATLRATSSNTGTASASLSGTGVQTSGLTINPTSKDFGSVPERGSSAPTALLVHNTGSGPQTITSVTLTGSQSTEFSVDPDTCGFAVVAGGATCTVKVTFTPTGSGSRSASLVVKSNANVSVTATLRGTGQAGRLGLDPNPTDFGVVAVGATSNAITVNVTNAGAAVLGISAVRVGGANAAEFLILSESCTGQQLAPAATCSVSVSFRPADAGTRTGSLDIDNTDGTTSAVLRGVGIFQAILKFTPPVASAGSLATVVGRSFPANTAITLQWQEAGIHAPLRVTTDSRGAFRTSFIIITGARLGPRHLEPAPDPGVLEEPRPVAPLLVQAPTFRPQGVAIRSGGFNPTLVTRG